MGTWTWLEFWNEHFPENRLYEQDNLDVWRETFQRMNPPATPSEILAAIQLLADGDAKKPGLRHVKRNIESSRRAAPQHNKSCRFCYFGPGWISLYPDLPDTGFDMATYKRAYSCGVPCTCPMGDAVIDSVKDYQGITADGRQVLNEKRRKAMSQQRHIEQMWRNMVWEDLPEASRPLKIPNFRDSDE